MKIFKRVVVCLAVVSFLVTMVSIMPTKAASEEEIMSLSEEEAQVRMDAQVEALGAYQKLFDTFGRNEDGSLLYPEDYAGAYIDGDKLVVMLTQTDEQTKIKYNMIYPEYVSTVIYQEAEYTLNQLYKIQEIGHELMKDFSITSYGVDEKNNETFIQVPEEEVEELTQTINGMRLASFPVKIEESIGENVATSVQLEGGMLISNPRSKASICIGGTYAGKNAILTCGHYFEPGDPVKLGDGKNTTAPFMGTVAYVRCNPSGTTNPGKEALGDFSIVLLESSSYQPTNKMKSENSSVYATGTYSSVPVGTSIYKYGQKTGYAYGTVSRTGVTQGYEEKNAFGETIIKYEVSGLTQTYMQNASGTNAIDSGDSGGCVYLKSGGNYLLCGDIAAMTRTTGTVNHVMYFSPIYYAIDQGFIPKLNATSGMNLDN